MAQHRSLSERRQHRLLTFLSIAVLTLSIVAVFRECRPEWQTHQRAYYRMAAARTSSPQQRAEILAASLEIGQVILPESRRVDRCISCHAGVEDPTMAGAPLPLSFHQALGTHRVAQFGCTCCHGGDGSAVTFGEAHGRHSVNPSSFLPKPYVRASCGRCHWEGEIQGVPELSRGRDLAGQYGCHGCHRFGGYGGRIGPELSAEGASGHMPEWHERHLIRPSEVTAGSPMPVFGFSANERRDVTFFLLSLVNRDADSPWFRMRILPTVANGEALLQTRGCLGCHASKGAAPELASLGSQLSAPYIAKLLTFPALKPESAMPAFVADPAEGRAIAAFLRTAAPDKIEAMRPASHAHTPDDEIAAAHTQFVRAGCVGCHGRTAAGGLPNPNSQGGQVPALVHLADDYTKDEVITIVRRGRLPPLLDPKKPAPPLYMPTWSAILTSEEIRRIVEFPWSLSAKNKTDAWQ